jgi:ABC-2 type transport system permease protein
MANGTSGLRGREAVFLVMRRELTTRLRSRAYRITLAVMVLAVVAISVVTYFVRAGDSSKPSTVGLLRQDAAVAAPLRAAGSAAGERLTTVEVPDAATGASEVRSGQLTAFVTTVPGGLRVTVDKTLDSTLRGVLTGIAREQALGEQITRLGGDPAAVGRAVNAAAVQVATLEPPSAERGQHITLGMIAGLLIYFTLMTCGQMIAQGVVEEKSSRVVELLLAAVRPWQLMAGKCLGLGLLGLLQVVVVGGAGVAAGRATGVLSLPLAGSLGPLLWSIAWYAAGFSLYALIFAATGAMVSRQEDLGGAQFPVLLPIIAAWVIGISVLPSHPDNGVAAVLSMIPLFAPVLMPMRIALGTSPVWQSALSLGLTVVLAVVMVRIAARVYRNSVLRSGARVGWREALKAA